jgi:hypothetical protein
MDQAAQGAELTRQPQHQDAWPAKTPQCGLPTAVTPPGSEKPGTEGGARLPTKLEMFEHVVIKGALDGGDVRALTTQVDAVQ